MVDPLRPILNPEEVEEDSGRGPLTLESVGCERNLVEGLNRPSEMVVDRPSDH